MGAARRAGANGWTKVRAKPEHLLTEPKQVATLDYRHVEDEDLSVEIEWSVLREGILHGVVAWFDTTLLDDIGFTNAPGAEPALYGNAFFPLTEAVEVDTGDRISLSLRASKVDGDYIWRWETSVREAISAGTSKARFSQHNLSRFPSLEALRRKEPRHVPLLNGRGQIDRFVLGRMDGQKSLQEIAVLLSEAFPDEFADLDRALEAVGEVSSRYSQA
jgi:hypothetical protein